MDLTRARRVILAIIKSCAQWGRKKGIPWLKWCGTWEWIDRLISFDGSKGGFSGMWLSVGERIGGKDGDGL